MSAMVVAGPTEEAGSEDDTALGCGLPAGVSMGNPFGVGALIASAAARASVSAASRLACIDGEIFFPSMDVIIRRMPGAAGDGPIPAGNGPTGAAEAGAPCDEPRG